MRKFFLDEDRLLRGPWQAFERDVARLLMHKGFADVRLVGGPNDGGADILGSLRNELWVVQCKFTANTPPPGSAVGEVVEAARYYGAHRMMIASSRHPREAFLAAVARYERTGLKVYTATPSLLLKWARECPEYCLFRKTLRDYQREAAERFRAGLVDTGRAQLVMATGLGKTVVMADVIADMLEDGVIPEGRVLVMAHTRDLVEQLQRSFWYQLPKWVPTHQLAQGERPAYWEGITFATVQTVRQHLGRLPHFGLILVDEAHHVAAMSFREAIDALCPPMLGGVTATPWRGDGYDIDEILGPPLIKIGIAEGLQRGFLADVDYRMFADNLDWRYIQKVSRYRYSLQQLNRKLIIPTRDEQAVRVIREVFDSERRTAGIVFSPSITHAQSFAGLLRQYGFRAEAISSDLPPRERELAMARFRSGYIQIACTVDLFNEGVDVPDVDLIVFMRVTHSRRIFVQQLGRGLRVSPKKDKVVVLDFVSDLRRVAEVLELDKAVRGGSVEHLGLGTHLVQFRDASAGSFLREWMLDQASLFLREEDPTLTPLELNFPEPPPSGAVQ